MERTFCSGHTFILATLLARIFDKHAQLNTQPVGNTGKNKYLRVEAYNQKYIPPPHCFPVGHTSLRQDKIKNGRGGLVLLNRFFFLTKLQQTKYQARKVKNTLSKTEHITAGETL